MSILIDLDSQLDYWNTEGPQKTFAHPLNLRRLSHWLSIDSIVIDEDHWLPCPLTGKKAWGPDQFVSA